ncbi:MAG: ABC transporter permease [Anaerolineae bacterium]|nr:ABC transporter permease [Anaerolineae bacterium]
MSIQLTLATRYLLGRKLRTVLTTIAIIFGVLLIFGMNTILPTMIAALQANVQGAEGNVDFSIASAAGGSFDPAAAEKLRDLDGVRAVSASLQRSINLPADFVDGNPARLDTLTAVNLMGITPEVARSIRAFPIVSGRYLDDSDTAAAVITQTLADSFSIRLGDTLTLPSAAGSAQLTIVGLLPGRLASGNEEVFVTLAQAQKMTGETGKVNLIELNVEAMAGQERRDAIQANIEATLGDSFRVGTLVAGDELFATMEMAQVGLSIFGMLALFMGGFIIFNTFRTVVSERRRDIGMLRALGATRRTILGMILAEGLIQGLLGSGLGLFFGYWLAVGTMRLAQGPMSAFINIQLGWPVISLELILISILAGVGVTVLAGLIPAFAASHVTPLEALRPSTAESTVKRDAGRGAIAGLAIAILSVAAIFSGQAALIMPGGLFFLLGLILIAPALVRPFALLFGRLTAVIFARQGIGGLAQSNLTRQPTRVAVTASASMLGLAVIVAAGGVVSSMTGMLGGMIKSSLGSDYLLVPPAIGVWGTNVGAIPEFADRLRDLDDVNAVSTFRYGTSNANGLAVSLIGIEPEAFQQVSGLVFSDGNESIYDKLDDDRVLIVNGPFLVATQAKVGDTIELLTPTGRVTYQIAASATDLLNAKLTTAYLSQANLQADFGATEDVFLQIDLRDGADHEAVGTQIKTLAADYPQFKVISGADYYASLMGLMDAAFYAVYILFAILAFPSLIAMLNTLTINVIERTREIGMLRAVGSTRKQIRSLVVAEALLLAALGTVFGILGGLYLGYVFVTAIDVMFPMGYYFPLSGILAAIAIGLLFGAIAAIIPARQAAGMNVVEALRYE